MTEGESTHSIGERKEGGSGKCCVGVSSVIQITGFGSNLINMEGVYNVVK